MKILKKKENQEQSFIQNAPLCILLHSGSVLLPSNIALYCSFCQSYLQYVCVGAALVRLTVLSVLEQHFVHVCAGVLEQTVGAVEDDESDLTVAQHAQLVGLLHQTKLTLGESDLEHPKHTEVCAILPLGSANR